MGAAIVFVSVVGPSMRAMTPEGRTQFSLNVVPRYSRYVLGTSVASIIFGVLLYGYSVMPNSTVAPTSSGLVWIDAGALLGVIAFILVVVIVWPSSKKLVRLAKDAKSGGSSGDVEAVQRKVRMGAGIVSGLLVIVLILMITGAVI
ncbi:MAG: hypothetical protein ACREBQ_06920, partial [Nitrososphaerales archaeon]